MNIWFFGLLLGIAFLGEAAAQNAPGALPWGVAPGSSSPSKKAHKNDLSPVTPAAGELFSHLHGIFGYGMESDSAEGTRSTQQDVELNLQANGYLLDPRLWSQNLSLDVAHYGTSSATSRVLGFNLNGIALSSRSFPLQVIASRTSSDEGGLNTDIRSSTHMFGLSWSLLKPKLATINVTAFTGGSTQNTNIPGAGFREHDRRYTANIGRIVHGWSLQADTDYSRIRTSVQNFETVLTESHFRVNRRFGKRGNLRTLFWHGTQSFSNLSSTAKTSLDSTLNQAQASLQYDHTDKLRGEYGVSYSSNVAAAAIASALQATTGTGTTGNQQLNPGLGQAILTNSRTASLQSDAYWYYAVTNQLTLGVHVGRTYLHTPDMLYSGQNILLQNTLLKGYTTLGGSASYIRNIGRWQLSWRADLTHHWNDLLKGGTYHDDRRAFGMGVNRNFRGWVWISDLSFLDYTTENALIPIESEAHWRNSFQTRLNAHLRLNVGGDFVHYRSTLPTTISRTKGKNNLFQVHGALNSLRWNVNGSAGMQNANSSIVALDLANPLNDVILGRYTSLIGTTSSADHFVTMSAGYRQGYRWTMHATYRHDSFQIVGGDFSHITDATFRVEYRLRRTVIVAGYERQNEQVGAVNRNFDRVFIRFRRPFRIY